MHPPITAVPALCCGDVGHNLGGLACAVCSSVYVLGGGTERRPTVLGSALPLDSLFSLGGGGRGGVCVCVHLCSCPRVIGCGPAGGDVQPHNTFVFFHCFFLIDIFAICVQSGHLFAARRCCGGGCPPCAGLSLSHFISFHFFSRFAFSLKRPPAHRWAFVCR